MSRALLAALFCLSVLAAGDPGPTPWIPTKLDDWAALQAGAQAYVAGVRAASGTFHAGLGSRVRGPEFNLISLPRPPESLSPVDLVVVNLEIKTGERSTVSCGQIALWKGADGTAVAATVCLDTYNLRTYITPSLIVDEDAFPGFLAKLVAEAKPPVGAWEIKTHKHAWAAIWQRPEGKTATLDDKRGVAPPLRPEDLAWLTGPPSPRPEAKPGALLTEAAYAARVAAHPHVQAALARQRSGRPAHPMVISGIGNDPDTPAARNGWKMGDIILSIDGMPVTSHAELDTWRGKTPPAPSTFRLLRADDSVLETVTQPGPQGFFVDKLPADPGLPILALAGAQASDAAVVLYACGEADLVATAFKRLAGHAPKPVISFLRAWQASYHGDFGRAEALLVGLGRAEPGLQRLADDLQAANRASSGRLLWAVPDFQKPDEGALVLRHLIKPLALAERFSLIEAGLPASAWPALANEVVKPMGPPAEHVLQHGGGILTASDETLTVEVDLAKLPARCRLEGDVVLKPAQITRQGNMFESPTESYVQLGFGCLSTTPGGGNGIRTMGYGGVRLWLDGSIEISPATFSRNSLTEIWYTVPGRIAIDGRSKVHVAIIRYEQVQRVEVDGRAVYNAWLPLTEGAAAGEESFLRLQASALVTPLSGFQLTMPAGPAKVSDF